jgi:hypothetical protein
MRKNVHAFHPDYSPEAGVDRSRDPRVRCRATSKRIVDHQILDSLKDTCDDDECKHQGRESEGKQKSGQHG